MDQAAFPGDTIGYIHFAPFLIGTSVIDTYYFELPVPSVHYANQGPKRKVGVRGSQGFGVEALTVGGLSPIEPRAVPTGIAHPALNRLHRLTQMRHEGGLHRRSAKEDQKNPA